MNNIIYIIAFLILIAIVLGFSFSRKSAIATENDSDIQVLSDNNQLSAPDIWKIKFDHRKWKKALMERYSQPNQLIIIYSLLDKKINSPDYVVSLSEYITAIKYEVNVTPMEYVQSVIEISDIDYEIIKSSSNEIILRLRYEKPSRIELSRIVSKNNAIYVLSYTTKDLTKNLDEWLKFLRESEAF